MRIIVDNNVHITLARSAQTHCKEHERNAQPCQRSFTRTRFTRRSSLLRNYFMMCINAADKWQIDVADTITFLLVFFFCSSSPICISFFSRTRDWWAFDHFQCGCTLHNQIDLNRATSQRVPTSTSRANGDDGTGGGDSSTGNNEKFTAETSAEVHDFRTENQRRVTSHVLPLFVLSVS